MQFHVRRLSVSIIVVLATFVVFGALAGLATPTQSFAAGQVMSADLSGSQVIRARRAISVPFGITSATLQPGGHEIVVTGPLKGGSSLCDSVSAATYGIRVFVTQRGTPGAFAKGETGGDWDCSALQSSGWEATATTVTPKLFETGGARVCAVALVRDDGPGRGRVVGFRQWCKKVTLVEASE